MKKRTYKLPVAIAFATALVAANAFALSTDSVVGDVASAIGGNGQVNVAVNGSTATLTGYANNANTANAARRAVLQHQEIDHVIDLISRN